MKYWIICFILGIGLINISCGGDQKTDASSEQIAAEKDSTTTSSYSFQSQGFAIPQHDCNISGEVLDQNQMLSQDNKILIVVKADSSTYDEDLEVNSHRILELYNIENCTTIDRKVLPVNVSADYPYYIARVSYNTNSQLIAIRGFNNIFVYDLNNNKLLPELQPEFKEERYGVDAQSGRILRIELWENYLIGYAQDYGAFAFDLSNNNTPKPSLPYTEWFSPDEVFHSLFLLPSGSGGQQILLPEYDFDQEVFKINPMFEKPQDIDAGQSGERFVVFSSQSNNGISIAIDLKEKKLVDLPQNIAQGTNDAILNWVKENN